MRFENVARVMQLVGGGVGFQSESLRRSTPQSQAQDLSFVEVEGCPCLGGGGLGTQAAEGRTRLGSAGGSEAWAFAAQAGVGVAVRSGLGSGRRQKGAPPQPQGGGWASAHAEDT